MTDASIVGLTSKEVVPIETSVEKARKSEDHDIPVASHRLYAGMTTDLTGMDHLKEGREPKVLTVAVANVLVLLIAAPDYATLIAIVTSIATVIATVETDPIVVTPAVRHGDRTFEVDPAVIGPTQVIVPLPTEAIDLTDHPKVAAHTIAEDHPRPSVAMTQKNLISRTDLLSE